MTFRLSFLLRETQLKKKCTGFSVWGEPSIGGVDVAAVQVPVRTGPSYPVSVDSKKLRGLLRTGTGTFAHYND